MNRLRRVMILVLGTALSLLVLGFILFASVVTREPAPADPHAQGIVVLTGPGGRITEGARLLKEGRAERMLITGVNSRTGKRALLKISGLPKQKFDCCVDLGYLAHDTKGNANETRSWAAARSYDTLIVVTSSWHMPRSLAELALALPGTHLIPYPVLPKTFPESGWWFHAATTRLLLAEYLKFLRTAAHLTLARMMGQGGRNALAEMPSERPAGI